MAQSKLELVTLEDMAKRLTDMGPEERDELSFGFSGIWCQFLCSIPIVMTLPRVVALEHGPKGCMGNVDTFFSPYLGHYWGQPTHIPKISTGLNENNLVMGAEGRLEEAIIAADKLYKPELICVMACCATGVTGEDMEGVVERTRDKIQADMIYINSPGFRNITMGDDMELVIDAFCQLLQEPEKKYKDSVNLLGLYKDTYAPPQASQAPTDVNEYGRYIEALGLRINSVVWGSIGGVKHLKKAPEAEFNAGTCVTWAIPMMRYMEERFGIPYSPHGQCLGVECNRRYIMAIAEHFGREDRGEEFFAQEYALLRDDFERVKEKCHGKVALLDGGRNTGGAVARTLMHARFAQELGMDPVIFNTHPLEVASKWWDVEYFLNEGSNPRIYWHNYPFGKALNPLKVMDMLNLDPKDVFYIQSDLFHYAMAATEPFEAEGVFDGSLIPKLNTSSHVRRCRSGPHRTYGLRGTHRLLREMQDSLKAVRRGVYPTFEARLSAV